MANSTLEEDLLLKDRFKLLGRFLGGDESMPSLTWNKATEWVPLSLEMLGSESSKGLCVMGHKILLCRDSFRSVCILGLLYLNLTNVVFGGTFV